MDYIIIAVIWIVIIFLYLIFNSRCNDLKRMIVKNERVEEIMQISRLLEEIKGRRCTIYTDSSYESIVDGVVIDVDESWVKIELVNKKSNASFKVIPLNVIVSVEMK